MSSLLVMPISKRIMPDEKHSWKTHQGIRRSLRSLEKRSRKLSSVAW
jgi:hypothetical protein